MAVPTRQTEPGPIRVQLRATKPDDYTQVSLTLPAEAVDESGGIRPAVLLRHLADDLDRNGEPALRRWLDAAEARHRPPPESGAAEMFQHWHRHWDKLDQKERNRLMGEWLDMMDEKYGAPPEAEIAAALERMTVEVDDDFEDDEDKYRYYNDEDV